LLARYVRCGLNPIEGAVALTFDDGPDPVYTVTVLDELARLGIHATFFLVGQNARAHPELVRRMLADGHAVGSHSDSHPDPWRLDVRELTREYRRGRAAVEQAAQQPVRLFRPPKGHVDGKGAVAMLSARVRPWRWTIDSHDWTPDVNVGDILERVSNVRAGDVVLLHDAIRGPIAPSALDRSATCAVLPKIAENVRGRHLRFATLS
jgi:peptidoglycan/xylan/chitin deacetylase (PgdA/CDA1 family)